MTDSGDHTEKTCFVIMPITTSQEYKEASGDQLHFPHVLEHLFTPALERVGYKVIAPSAQGSEIIQAGIIRKLEQADLVLCDMSSLNPNVFFELGIRTALDRPVVLVRDSITRKLPFDISALNTHTYEVSLDPWILAEQIPQLAAHISRATEGASQAGNAMWKYFGLTKRADPSEAGNNPLEAKLDLILSEVTKPRETNIVNQIFKPSEFVEASGDTDGGHEFIERLSLNVLSLLRDTAIVVTEVSYFPNSRVVYIETQSRVTKNSRQRIEEILPPGVKAIYGYSGTAPQFTTSS